MTTFFVSAVDTDCFGITSPSGHLNRKLLYYPLYIYRFSLLQIYLEFNVDKPETLPSFNYCVWHFGLTLISAYGECMQGRIQDLEGGGALRICRYNQISSAPLKIGKWVGRQRSSWGAYFPLQFFNQKKLSSNHASPLKLFLQVLPIMYQEPPCFIFQYDG